jgi:hypothetical protein
MRGLKEEMDLVVMGLLAEMDREEMAHRREECGVRADRQPVKVR